jgi:hypothetical protein
VAVTEAYVANGSSPNMVIILSWTSKESWFDAQEGQKMHLFFKAFKLAVGLSTASYSVGTGSCFHRVKMSRA